MKRNVLILCITLFLIPVVAHADGLDDLSKKVSTGILDFFSGKINVRTAVVRFDNYSDLSGLAAQRYYQVVVSHLESQASLQFTDLMVHVRKERGEFNLTRLDKLNYLIYLKLVRNRDKIGTGVAIFSRTLDKIVYVKYYEELLPAAEIEFIEQTDYGFKSVGFARRIEIEAQKNLLDFKGILTRGGDYWYFFFYPHRIDIYKIENNRFRKFFNFKLNWERPYWPVLNYEGRMALFYQEDTLYLTLGTNFSPNSKIFSYSQNTFREVERLEFVPLRLVRLGDSDYLAGGQYAEAKNYFVEKLLLVPVTAGEIQKEEILLKQVPPFYSLDFSLAVAPTVEGIHLVDTDYNYRFLGSDFEEKVVEPERRGSALAVFKAKWLAVSDYSTGTDKLYFYKIEEGTRQLVYENTIRGEVILISGGSWQSRDGVWVYVKKNQNGRDEYSLQFWSENDG